MSYPCPRCGDKSTQKLSLMYESHTRRWKNQYGRERSSQSDLASKYPPPQPRGTTGRRILQVLLCLAAVQNFLIGISVRSLATVMGAFVCAAIIIPLQWSVRRTKKYNLEVYEPANQSWHSSFICQGCECLFTPKGLDNFA